jgi:hypothetical protein
MAESKLFGSRRRTEVLIITALLSDTYPTEIARLLSAPLYSVQKIVEDFGREGILALRVRGRQKVVSLDPRYFASRELRSLLLRLAEAEPELRAVAATRRVRPTRRGREL